MKLGSTHSHLFQNPQDLDRVAESGKFAFIWMLGLSPQGKCHYDNKIFNYADDASMLETAKRYPGFIYPFRKLDYLDGPDQIDRALEMGYKGFKAISPPLPYDHDSYLPLYERMEKYKASIVFHTGHVNTPRYRERVPGNGYDALHMNPSTLLKLSNFFPDLTLIAAHCGIPWQNDLLSLSMLGCKNLYMDISGGEEEAMNRFIRANAMTPATLFDGSQGILADKLLYGLDCCFGYDKLHNDVFWCWDNRQKWISQLQEEKVPWVDKLPEIFLGNAERLMARLPQFN